MYSAWGSLVGWVDWPARGLRLASGDVQVVSIPAGLRGMHA